MTKNEMFQLAFLVRQMQTRMGHWDVAKDVIAAFEVWDVAAQRDKATEEYHPGPGGQIFEGFYTHD